MPLNCKKLKPLILLNNWTHIDRVFFPQFLSIPLNLTLFNTTLILDLSLFFYNSDHCVRGSTGQRWVQAGKPYWMERLSIMDLLILTSLDLQLFKIENIIYYWTKDGTLMWRSIVLSFSFQWVIPWFKRCHSHF